MAFTFMQSKTSAKSDQTQTSRSGRFMLTLYTLRNSRLLLMNDALCT
jgi:hypothetical protein